MIKTSPQPPQAFADIGGRDCAVPEHDSWLRRLTDSEKRQPVDGNANIGGAVPYFGNLIDR